MGVLIKKFGWKGDYLGLCKKSFRTDRMAAPFPLPIIFF